MDSDLNYLETMKDHIENSFRQITNFKNFNEIFKTFTKVHSKNQYFYQNLKSFLTYIENNQEPETVVRAPKIVEKKNKIKIGRAISSEVFIDTVQEAQIFKGPNPNLTENLNSPHIEVDSRMLGRVNENIKKGRKIEFINNNKEIFFKFKPKKNLDVSVCKFDDHEIKITFVNKKFIIQASPRSGKSYLCLFKSQIITKQIYQVGMTSIIIDFINGKFQLTYFKKGGNKYIELLEKEIFFYKEGDNLTTEKQLESELVFKIIKTGDKWFICSTVQERIIFRSLHNLETFKLNKSSAQINKESLPLLLCNDMLMNVNETFFKVLKESEDDY